MSRVIDSKTVKKQLGEAIMAYCVANKITITRFAEHYKLNRILCAQLEKGDPCNPTLSSLEKIEAALKKKFPK